MEEILVGLDSALRVRSFESVDSDSNKTPAIKKVTPPTPPLSTRKRASSIQNYASPSVLRRHKNTGKEESIL